MTAMLTPRDVAAAWQCSAGHVRKLCRTGQLRGMRLSENGRADWRISPEAVSEFVAGHTNAADVTPNVALRQTVSHPVLTVVPPTDMDGALPYGWWETQADSAALPAAQRGGSTTKKRTGSDRT